jgi:hypothetical protein
MSRLTWDDLLIREFSQDDCRRWLEPWSWLVGGVLAPEWLNKFGSWFFRRPEGHVEMLDVLTGTIEKVADSYQQFIAFANQPAWQEVYLLSRRVYELHERGTIPGAGQCYALAPHPLLGGPNPISGEPVDPGFVMVMDIGAWQFFCSQLLRDASS